MGLARFCKTSLSTVELASLQRAASRYTPAGQNVSGFPNLVRSGPTVPSRRLSQCNGSAPLSGMQNIPGLSLEIRNASADM